MNVFLWVLQGVLAAAFLMAGGLKLARSKEQLAGQMPWVEDFPPPALKFIGFVELLAAAGLILPPATDIAPVLAPLAATGLVVTMLGAMATHLRRREYQNLVVNVVLLVIAAVVAWGRFGPYSF